MTERRKGKHGAERRRPARPGPEGPGLSGLWIAPALVVAAALAILLLDRETGIVPLASLRGEVSRIEARVEALAAERGRLRSRVVALQTDPLEVEALARERLGMVRPGEVVLRLAGAD
jgi:cell division protein FtsB